MAVISNQGTMNAGGAQQTAQGNQQIAQRPVRQQQQIRQRQPDQQQGAVQQRGGPQMAGGNIPKPNSLDEMLDRFQQLHAASPDMADDVIENATSSGLTGQILEDIGYAAAVAILDPTKYKDFLAMIAQAYPQEAAAFPEDYAQALEVLYELAFAAYLQDGGEI